jgi:hypothetical protein
MGRRNRSTRPVESAEQSGPGMTIDPPGLLVLLSPISGPGTHLAAPGIVGDSFPKISDPYAPAVPYYKGKPLRSFFWSLSRRRVVKQLFATPTTTCNSSISLAEQDRLFNSQNIRMFGGSFITLEHTFHDPTNPIRKFEPFAWNGKENTKATPRDRCKGSVSITPIWRSGQSGCGALSKKLSPGQQRTNRHEWIFLGSA